jgi:hypothetical protein
MREPSIGIDGRISGMIPLDPWEHVFPPVIDTRPVMAPLQYSWFTGLPIKGSSYVLYWRHSHATKNGGAHVVREYPNGECWEYWIDAHGNSVCEPRRTYRIAA